MGVDVVSSLKQLADALYLRRGMTRPEASGAGGAVVVSKPYACHAGVVCLLVYVVNLHRAWPCEHDLAVNMATFA